MRPVNLSNRPTSRLKDTVAIITGGGTGIGAATSRLFASEGSSVVVTGHREHNIKEVADSINNNKGKAIHMIHDISSESDWVRIVDSTISVFGKIDILVNNGAISGNLFLSLDKRTIEEFNTVISTNLLSQFLGIKTTAPFLKNGASIVNISSIAGITGNAGANAYTASKGGTRLLSKGAAIDLAKKGIRVNSVHPGYVETPMVTNMEGAQAFKEMAIASTPLGRGASPEEIAYGILFLASKEASFVTGSELIIDGGFTAF